MQRQKSALWSRQLFATVAMAGLLGALVSGCGSCTRSEGKNAEHFVAQNSPGFAYAPSSGELARKAQALMGTVRSGPGGERVVKLAANLARQMGFDVLSPSGLGEAGIDLSRPWVFALGVVEVEPTQLAESLSGAGAYLVLPYKDLNALEASILRVREGRIGPLTRTTTQHEGVKLVVHTPESGDAPPMVWAAESGNLVVSIGDEAKELVAAAVHRVKTNSPSIASDGTLEQLRSRLGDRELYIHAGQGADDRAFWKDLLPEGISAGIGLEAKEISLRLYLGLKEERLATFREFFGGGNAQLLELMPEAAPVVVRGNLNLKALVDSTAASAAGKVALDSAREALAEFDIDLDDELLDNLQPGFALAASLSPTINLSRAFDFNPRRANPLASYSLRGVGMVKDAEKAQALLDKLVPLSSTLGFRITTREEDDIKMYTAHYHLGESVSWTLAGNHLLWTGGLQDALLPWAKAVSEPENARKTTDVLVNFPPKAQQSLSASTGIALGANMAKVRDDLAALPTSAFGVGPGALMARSVATNLVQPLARLKGVASLTPEEQGLALEISVGID